MPNVPDTIGPYEVIRPIAQGGMAEVFEVRDPESGERRALKLLMELRTSVKRFNREFEAMTRLNHPNIVRVYRYGYHGQNPWMSMELLRGEPLQNRVREFGSPGAKARTREVVRIAWSVANALQYIHDRGLVHRDLKSANVQVLRDGRVKLLDFGTAHLVDPLEKLTQEGDFVGTFSYAAPEQIVGARIDHRADLYALGVLLYRLLSGRRPYKADDPHTIAQMHLHEAPRRLRELVPDVPVELDDLVHALMQKQRKDRPQRADEAVAALERIGGRQLGLEGLGIALYEDLALERTTELRALWRTVIKAPAGRLVTVSGGDEVERRWFVDHAIREGEQRGLACLRAEGRGGVRALADAFEALVQDEDPTSRRLAALLAGPDRHLADTMIDVAPEILRAFRGDAHAVLVAVDGVDRADPATLDVLGRFLARAGDGPRPLHLLATADADAGATRALAAHASGASSLGLEPLDVRRTALAVGNLLHRRPPPPDTARHLHDVTGGHPALIADVVRAMAERGQLGLRDDQGNFVEWPAEVDEALPDVVRASLEQRTGTLPLPWRHLLEILDVLGGRAELDQLAIATGVRPGDLQHVVREMIEAGHLHARGAELVPDDPLVVRFLGATMSGYRRGAAQHLVAEVVERQAPNPAQVRLLVAVGRSSAALDRALACARDLLDRGSVAEGLDLLERVHAYADHPGLPSSTRVAFHLLFAEGLQRAKPMDARAMRSLEAADRLAAGTPDAARVKAAQAEQQRAIGHYANHRRYLLEAWDAIEHDSRADLRARVALELGDSHVYGAQVSPARTWYDAALEAAVAADDGDIADRARVGLAALQVAQGDADAAEDVLERLMAARGDQGDPLVRWSALATWGHALRRQGRFSAALERLHPAVAAARDAQSLPAWAAVTLAAAYCELDLTRLGRAQELVEELASALGQGERLHVRLETKLCQARIQLASGQPVAANFLLEEVVDQAEKAGLSLLAEVGRAFLAEARWSLGSQEESKLVYQKALLGLMSTGDLCSLADAIVSRARMVGATEDPTKAFRLVRRLLARGKLQPLYIEHLLSEMRWYASLGEQQLMRQSLREAQNALNRLAASQSTIEQATLRVHPWAHEITAVLATDAA